MNVTIVDYNSGNISSVINSFNEVAKDKVNIEVTSDLNKIKSSDKVVLPGQGSFKSCVDALNNIDGKGKYKIETGIGFLNHMLEQLSKHSSIDINLKAKGDTHIDLHHTTEDTGIAIGECLKKASKKFVGIKRYAHAMIPMDETLTRVAIDVSNRPYLIWKVKLKVEKLGEMDTELFKEWFQAFSQAAGITLHVENIYGDNSHHIIESCFKGLARSLRAALEMDPRNKNTIPSTKGSL